jgi:hypothetical protein
VREPVQLLKPRETPKDFEFFENSHPPAQADMLVQGLVLISALFVQDEIGTE